MSLSSGIASSLAAVVGAEHVLTDELGPHLRDASPVEPSGPPVEALVRPGSAVEVRELVAWAYDHDVPITPRGGGTGLAGGAVPVAGGVVLSLERLTAVRELEPACWRIGAEAGLTTAHVQRLARENGLFFAANPGAAEQSQLGGNLATNAGGPRAFKYGSVGAAATGLEVVVPPGELIRLGGTVSKDVAGYDLAGLLIGSEGTLGVITAGWLRLTPAPESRGVAVGFPDSSAGVAAAVQEVLVSGLVPSAVEYLDRAALAAVSATFPGSVPANAGGAVLVEVDGFADSVQAALVEIEDALSGGACARPLVARERDADPLLAWRESVSSAVAAQVGAKLSEDISVPVDRLAEAIDMTIEIGRRHRLDACSWGHAGDGNLHATFLVSPERPDELRRAGDAAVELFELAVRLGGSISGEHGLGVMKNGYLRHQWDAHAVSLHRQVKSAFDPKNLMNPGKKLP